MPFPDDWVLYPDGSVGPPGRRLPPGSREPRWAPEGDSGKVRDLEAIETTYNGVTYRSRSEARWAYVFDGLGLKHMYEPQVVDTPHGKYLPDFYLPTQGCWIEVKGPHPTWLERDKAMALARSSGRPVYIFSCSVPQIGVDGAPVYECGTPAADHSWRYNSDGSERPGFMFGVKECCGRVAVVFNALTNLIQCGCPPVRYNPDYLYTFQLVFQKARLRKW